MGLRFQTLRLWSIFKNRAETVIRAGTKPLVLFSLNNKSIMANLPYRQGYLSINIFALGNLDLTKNKRALFFRET